ncbi:MAG: hypothetical protein LBC97_06035 [Bifidobacteriaceae bacterium]|nr:hypothetical protein [Bifidobacteriaceae bacterium]
MHHADQGPNAQAQLEACLASVPWDRLATFYGRATRFPEQARLIASGRADGAVFKEVADGIEHQDGVIQASPFVTRALIELLRAPKTDKAALVSVLEQVYRAAVFQTGPEAPAPEEAEIPLEEELLGPFVSEDEDEIMWEEWNPANWLYWPRHCREAIEGARELIESFSGQSGELGRIASSLFAESES